MNQMNESTKTTDTRRRFSRWVLSAVLLLTVTSILVWFGWSIREQIAEVQYFEQRGGQVTTKRISPAWLNKAKVETVGDSLSDIRTLSLQDTGVSDAAVEELSNLSHPVFEKLERINLENTGITDASLKHLGGLKNLKRLILENTNVTDAGLADISVVASLEALNLEQTQVTDEGLPQLETLIRLQELALNKTSVSDDGLRHLQIHTGLRYLDLRDTNVTEDGIAEIQSRLPDCKVMHSFGDR